MLGPIQTSIKKTMPSVAKASNFVVTIAPGTPEYKVVESLRTKFATKSEKGNIRRANGVDLVSQVISNLLLKASPDTLAALSKDSENKQTVNGTVPTLKIKDVIQSIVEARPVLSSREIDVIKLTKDERAKLRKELDEADESERAKKGT